MTHWTTTSLWGWGMKCWTAFLPTKQYAKRCVYTSLCERFSVVLNSCGCLTKKLSKFWPVDIWQRLLGKFHRVTSFLRHLWRKFFRCMPFWKFHSYQGTIASLSKLLHTSGRRVAFLTTGPSKALWFGKATFCQWLGHLWLFWFKAWSSIPRNACKGNKREGSPHIDTKSCQIS